VGTRAADGEAQRAATDLQKRIDDISKPDFADVAAMSKAIKAVEANAKAKKVTATTLQILRGLHATLDCAMKAQLVSLFKRKIEGAVAAATAIADGPGEVERGSGQTGALCEADVEGALEPLQFDFPLETQALATQEQVTLVFGFQSVAGELITLLHTAMACKANEKHAQSVPLKASGVALANLQGFDAAAKLANFSLEQGCLDNVAKAKCSLDEAVKLAERQSVDNAKNLFMQYFNLAEAPLSKDRCYACRGGGIPTLCALNFMLLRLPRQHGFPSLQRIDLSHPPLLRGSFESA
jgi:hypothetical protein